MSGEHAVDCSCKVQYVTEKEREAICGVREEFLSDDRCLNPKSEAISKERMKELMKNIVPIELS